MAYTALDEATKQAVIAEAQNRANRFGISKEQALYNYAKENGIDNASVDTLMGFAQGSTDAWLKQRDAGITAGQQAAPQGYSYGSPAASQPAPQPQRPQQQGNGPLVSSGPGGGYDPWARPQQQGNGYTAPSAPAASPATPVAPWRPTPASPWRPPAPTSVQPLEAAQRASVVQQAQDIATKYGISPEMALWNYANQNGIDPAGIDSYMGFAPGTSSDWAAKNGVGGAPSKNLGMGGLPAALDPTQRASVVQQAQDIAKQQGITPEQALYNYAQKNNISNAGIDAYMGYQPGAADTWLKQNPQDTTPKSGGYPDGGADADYWNSVGHGGAQHGSQPSGRGYPGGGQQQNNQQGSLGMGGYNPQQNPYLRQMGVDVGNQMFDQWSRNTLPSIRSGAMAAGGFGGSRQGVVEANGINDMNRQYGQALTSMYGNDWSQQQGRNLQQQGLNNSYDLGLRSSDLGFSNLDANINQNNFNNQLASANFGMGVYNTLNNQTQAGIQAGTNIQNTPLDYQKYFTNSANGVGSGYGTSSTSQTNQGNPWFGALGGAMMGNQIQKNWG